jgi:hypothetical protein
MPVPAVPTAPTDPADLALRRERAEIILEQLGGRRFLAMTGARDLYFDDTGLRFALPNQFALQGINRVQIALTPMDTYTLRAHCVKSKRGGMPTVTLIDEIDGIYWEELAAVFERLTGLRTRL